MQSAGPSVRLLLELDNEYREKSNKGELQKIAPRKFNPSGEAWLPVMRAEREGWRFALLFSNTARAHELGKTNDWVVVYYDAGNGEKQCTIVTEYEGKLAGRRVVRGREGECEQHYNA
jgi:DNA polymerase (family 10)